MSANNSQGSQPERRQRVLEEKLKSHIQREFHLGEKVIALLKQKKELEQHLQEQQQAQKTLKQNLETVLQSKSQLEQQFVQTQQNLQQQRHSLQRRTQMIVASEEDSRGTLDQLQQKIQQLEQQLQTVDRQRVAERNQLIRKVRFLRKKEQQQQQKLQDIAQQRDFIETQLQELVQEYERFSKTHLQERYQYEQKIAFLTQEQQLQETQISSLEGEQQGNDEDLHQELDALRMSKAELERQVAQMKQQQNGQAREMDADLLQVIEKQAQFIEELKTQAHQRSTLLRTENETLREEIAIMTTSQQQTQWENTMLESSLKDLQSDLAQYIHVKQKFDDVQREKAAFEEKFQRRLQFLDHPATAPQAAGQIAAAEAETEAMFPRLIHEEAGEPETDFASWRHSDETFGERVGSFWVKMTEPRIMNVILIGIALLLAFEIAQLIPWRYIFLSAQSVSQPVQPPRRSLTERAPTSNAEIASEKKTPFLADSLRSVAAPRPRAVEPPATPTILPLIEPVQSPPRQTVSPPRKSPPPRPIRPRITVAARPVPMLIYLPASHAAFIETAPSREFPTIHNNSILRRRQQTKKFAACQP